MSSAKKFCPGLNGRLYAARWKKCSKTIEQLSWAQEIVLQAATQVDYLDFRSHRQVNLPTGVWRSLVRRGFLRPVKYGWQITVEGQALLLGGYERKEELLMDGKLPRYRVTRTIGGWAVIDTSIAKIKMHNDVVERFPARDAARAKARELNLQELQEKIATGDAA